MTVGDAFYLGVPLLCLAGMAWLFWEGVRVSRPEFDEYNRRMDEADRGWEEFEAELQIACERYAGSVN